MDGNWRGNWVSAAAMTVSGRSFCSDLGRAVETASIAFGSTEIPVLHDWRLRDYGTRNGMPTSELRADRARLLDRPYPAGESWRSAMERVGRFLPDISLRWSGLRVLVIGHVATNGRSSTT